MKVSRACVTNWCHKGLPVLPSGKLDRAVSRAAQGQRECLKLARRLGNAAEAPSAACGHAGLAAAGTRRSAPRIGSNWNAVRADLLDNVEFLHALNDLRRAKALQALLAVKPGGLSRRQALMRQFNP
jgi:hypothetical protein